MKTLRYFFNQHSQLTVYTLDEGSEYNIIAAVFCKSNFHHATIAGRVKLRCFSCQEKYVLFRGDPYYIIIPVNQINAYLTILIL